MRVTISDSLAAIKSRRLLLTKFPKGLDRNEIKFLLIDTEWSYALAYFFPSKRDQFIPARNIKHHQFCPCAAYKWLGLGNTTIVSVLDDKERFKRNFRDDYHVAKTMHEVMTEADVIIGHNGDFFDIRNLNVIFRRHELGPIPEKKTIDTLKAARKYFNFAGNSLADLLREFGLPTKEDKPDWTALTEGCPKAIKKAGKYCGVDVDRLEPVFLEIRPFMRKQHILKKPGQIKECDACQSKRVNCRGDTFFNGKIYKRVICMECGHNMRGDIKFYQRKI